MKAFLLILLIASPAFGQTRKAFVGPPTPAVIWFPTCGPDTPPGLICKWPDFVQTFTLGVPDNHVARKVAIVVGDQFVPSGPTMSAGFWWVRADGLICAQSPGFGEACWTFLTP